MIVSVEFGSGATGICIAIQSPGCCGHCVVVAVAVVVAAFLIVVLVVSCAVQ